MKIGGYDKNNMYTEVEVDRDYLVHQLYALDMYPTGYERVGQDEYYYTYDTTMHEVVEVNDNGTDEETSASLDYADANYYADEQLAIDNIRADKLMRNIRRFAVLKEGKAPITNVTGWAIVFNDLTGAVKSEFIPDKYRTPFTMLFSKLNDCLECITKFRDELNWYFNEYSGARNGVEGFDE